MRICGGLTCGSESRVCLYVYERARDAVSARVALGARARDGASLHSLSLSSSHATGLHQGAKVKVVTAQTPERKLGAWLGGSILASLSGFEDMWLSRSDYMEHGAARVHKVFQ